MKEYVPLPEPEEGMTWLVFPNSPDTVFYVNENDIEDLENGEVMIKKGAKAIVMERKEKE